MREGDEEIKRGKEKRGQKGCSKGLFWHLKEEFTTGKQTTHNRGALKCLPMCRHAAAYMP